MYYEEIKALDYGWKYYIVRIDRHFLLYLRCYDYSGNSYSGQFDYHWYYHTYQEAKVDGLRLSN